MADAPKDVAVNLTIMAEEIESFINAQGSSENLSIVPITDLLIMSINEMRIASRLIIDIQEKLNVPYNREEGFYRVVYDGKQTIMKWVIMNNVGVWMSSDSLIHHSIVQVIEGPIQPAGRKKINENS